MGAALIAATLTGLATGLGALPFLFVRELPRRVYDGILGLGAGLMLAAATLGLLAEALAGVRTKNGTAGGGLDGGHLALVIGGFATGVAIAAAMDRLIPHRHARGHHQHLGHAPGHDHHDRHPGAADSRRGYAIIGALTIHRVPEGLAIGAGFAAVEHARLGLLLAIVVGPSKCVRGNRHGRAASQRGRPRGPQHGDHHIDRPDHAAGGAGGRRFGGKDGAHDAIHSWRWRPAR